MFTAALAPPLLCLLNWSREEASLRPLWSPRGWEPCGGFKAPQNWEPCGRMFCCKSCRLMLLHEIVEFPRCYQTWPS